MPWCTALSRPAPRSPPEVTADAETRGFFYKPTVLTDVRQEMEIIRREVFGPVLPIVTFDEMDEAVAYANDFRLWAHVIDLHARPRRRHARLPRDTFWRNYVNRENFEAMQGFHAGWRKSGIGGADGKHGLYEFLQTHVVYLQRQATD